MHLEWLIDKPCVLSNYSELCNYRKQAHHLLTPLYSSRGIGMRAGDKDAIPLCMDCHRKLHSFGNEKLFFLEMTGDADYGQKQCSQLWNESPYNDEF